MTADTLAKLTALTKKYARIDYTDDDDLVEIMVDAVVESMGEVIPGFNADAMTGRQKIILFKSVKDLYDDREKYGKDAVVNTIHAGLECGIIASKIDGLDCISMGPDNYDLHTPDERLSISSFVSVWEFICDFLRQK